MEPYYQDDTIQIVQFKGPTTLEAVQTALAEFLGTPDPQQRRFMLELQRASFDFDLDDASEFYLFVETYLSKEAERLVVVVLSPEEQAREPSARLLKKLDNAIQANPYVAIAPDLASAHDLFAEMTERLGSSGPSNQAKA